MKRLYEQYQAEMIPKLLEMFGYGNRFSAPRMEKVTVNVGLGRALSDKTLFDAIGRTLLKITGQRPAPTHARKSIAGFKVRKGMALGMKVTLRGKRMYDFIEKLTRVSFARVPDFRGLSTKTVDLYGNMSVGFREHIAFPEITADDMDHTHGLQVTITTSAKNREEGLALFRILGFPLKKEE